MGSRLPLVLGLLLVTSQAHAGGGAHVVDDATVETPGVCHLESWITRFAPGRGLLNSSPACTREAWPRLEIGGAITHFWDDVDDTHIGPALKVNLLPVESGFGLGLIGRTNWTRSLTLDTAGLIVPASITVNERVQANLNAGWVYGRTSVNAHDIFYGAQLEVQIVRDISLMVETFGRGYGYPGGQLGLRWTPNDGRFEVDLLVGRRIDGINRDAITLGFTART